MSLWSRLTNLLRPGRLNGEIDDELTSHLEEAVARGREVSEARRAFGSSLRMREESRDIRIIPWLDSLRADTVFGWRQLSKRKVTSAAAILSLALAIGACTTAFRLVDALLLRPLPVASPERLYAMSFERTSDNGKVSSYDSCSYPFFRQARAAAGSEAELIAVSYAERTDLTYASDEEMEKAYRQYVSGSMFERFGLRPAVGRLLRPSDDVQPGAHPYAVLSHDYWTSRFGGDPNAVGRTFKMGTDVYEIVGVAEAPFTGTETGTATDIFVPMMMGNAGSLSNSSSFWFRTLVQMPVGGSARPLRDKLDSLYRDFERERAKSFVSFQKQTTKPATLLIEAAPAGVSRMQSEYRRALAALGVLVALVLLIACANVANLMTAQAAARSREMALRVSIGAGRARLVQLVLVESGLVAGLSSVLGIAFTLWSAPFVLSRINPPDSPARLALPLDWRLLAFGVALAVVVNCLFGVIPALRASRVRPASALKGGEDPQSRRRLMNGLIAAQVAFCFVVLLVAGLFVSSFERLSRQPLGFSAERVLLLDTVAAHAQSFAYWDQLTDRLRALPGVETAALAAWPLMSGTMSNNYVSIGGAPPSPVLAFFMQVSPGWVGAMKIPLLDGRDFRAGDTHPSSAIVNQKFARQYFDGSNPVGKSFDVLNNKGVRIRYQVVGLAGDAVYRNLREPMLPIAYFPWDSVDDAGVARASGRGTFIVRTAGASPLGLASMLRREVAAEGRGFRVTNLRTQIEIDEAQTVRERLLAMLALFFGVVALMLAGIGLYGVLDYSVVQRRREIGIRMAVGARAGHVARRVTAEVFWMVGAGTVAGIAGGLASARYIESLLYEVKGTDLPVMALPAAAILAVAIPAAVPAVVRAVRIDPVIMLRSE